MARFEPFGGLFRQAARTLFTGQSLETGAEKVVSTLQQQKAEVSLENLPTDVELIEQFARLSKEERDRIFGLVDQVSELDPVQGRVAGQLFRPTQIDLPGIGQVALDDPQVRKFTQAVQQRASAIAQEAPQLSTVPVSLRRQLGQTQRRLFS